MSDSIQDSGERYQLLLNGRRTTVAFYNEVCLQAEERIPGHSFNRELKAPDLVDPDLWGDDKGMHQLIGRCIAHAVATGRLPLRFAGCPRCSNKRYLRT